MGERRGNLESSIGAYEGSGVFSTKGLRPYVFAPRLFPPDRWIALPLWRNDATNAFFGQWPTSSDYGWPTSGGYGWYASGESRWLTPGDYGWPISGDYQWYTSGDSRWLTPGDYGWPPPGDTAWLIIARSVAAVSSIGARESSGAFSTTDYSGLGKKRIRASGLSVRASPGVTVCRQSPITYHALRIILATQPPSICIRSTSLSSRSMDCVASLEE